MSEELAKAQSKASLTGSKQNLLGSKANLGGSNRNLAGSKANLSGSKGNLAGGNGSKWDLVSSRVGSIRNLNKSNMALNVAANERENNLAANAIVYENTYRLKPEKKFQGGVVKKVIEEVLTKHLTKVKYEENACAELTKLITTDILAGVKAFEFDRYKLIVQVDIGEFKGQGIKVASRSIWDTTTDSYASASFKNATLFAVAMVFGLYYE